MAPNGGVGLMEDRPRVETGLGAAEEVLDLADRDNATRPEAERSSCWFSAR